MKNSCSAQHGAALAVALAMATLGGRAEAQAAPAPKLIVTISIDQFSENLLDDWLARFTGGLARLAQGVRYSNAYHSHAATETCPGHAVLLTGRHPNKTGIIANTFHDPDTGKPVYCVNDPSVVLAHDPKASPVGPKRLMASTLGDWLKAASPASRVVSVSTKDRSAIALGGQAPDAAFWLVGNVGFTTYMRPGADAAEALAPVVAFNARIAPIWRTPPRWNFQHADCRAAEATWTFDGKPWRSTLPPENWTSEPKEIASQVLNSPQADELTALAAIELVNRFRLGRGPATDLLAVSFSATDFIAHRYGSRGPEMCEQMHRLDVAIGGLLLDLDRLGVPYIVALSADHGGADFAERLQAQGFPQAKRISSTEILARVNSALMAEFTLTAPPLRGSVEEADIVGVADEERPRVLAAAVRFLGAQPEIAGAFTREELLATRVRKGTSPEALTLKQRFALSTYPGRSPEILAALQPGYSVGKAAPGSRLADHGSPWDYDRRVPLLFWWPGVKAETRYLPVETVDIAPTLAAAVRIAPPSDVDGRCLPLPAASGIRCPAS